MKRNSRLPRAFYERPTEHVAKDLLGKHLVHVTGGIERRARIVEVEAYVGAHDLAPELLASPGVLSRTAPNPVASRAVAMGFAMLRDLAAYDMAQACIIAGERCLAIEGPEGTDSMLGRVRSFRRPWSRIRVASGGVLVKTAKRGQDLRVDLPVIGPRTMVNARRAGLEGIAVGSGATMILEQERTIAAADRLGLFLVAVEPAAAPGQDGE